MFTGSTGPFAGWENKDIGSNEKVGTRSRPWVPRWRVSTEAWSLAEHLGFRNQASRGRGAHWQWVSRKAAKQKLGTLFWANKHAEKTGSPFEILAILQNSPQMPKTPTKSEVFKSIYPRGLRMNFHSVLEPSELGCWGWSPYFDQPLKGSLWSKNI